MLPIDPGDGQGSVTPARPVEDIVPFQGRVPAQAMSRGGTIIRPGAVAWGGMRDSTDSGYSSCEAIERILASVAADPGQLPGLLNELTTTRLWVPLPARHRPFTDGTAVRLPLIEAEGEDFVPCFTSVQRLTAWVEAADLPPAAPSEEAQFAESGRRWQRAGDARVVPHLVVPAVGLARRLPSGLGLALNADGANGLPLYPESVSCLARLAPAETTAEAGRAAGSGGSGQGRGRLRCGHRPAGHWTRRDRAADRAIGPARCGHDQRAADTPTGAAVGVGHPPVEPRALLDETRAGLRALRFVRYASRAWLSVPGAGEGLVISSPSTTREARRAAAPSSTRWNAPAPPFRSASPSRSTSPSPARSSRESTSPSPDMIDEWISRNTRPFYTRD